MTTHDPTRLVLVRHGETVWHAENRYAGGSSDIDLTDRGREQAAALGRWAASQHLDALVVSPVRRAQETAAPIAAATGLHPVVDPDLREVDFGIAEGRTLDELAAADAGVVERFRADPAAHPFPGSEPPAVAAARATRALRALAAAHPGGRVVVVAHNTLLRLALCELLGLPVGGYRQVFPRLETAALTEVGVVPDPAAPASLLLLNAPPPDPAPTPAPHHHNQES